MSEHFPPVTRYRSRLADVTYLLACIGPLWQVVYAVQYAFRYIHGPAYTVWTAAAVLLGAASPLAVVLGVIASWKAPQQLLGRERARAGAILGAVGTLWSLMFAPDLMKMGNYIANPPGLRYSCVTNEKQLGLALMMYAQDYDDRLPLTANWNASIWPYIKIESVYRCPSEFNQKEPSYGYNGRLKAANTEWIQAPALTVWIFDSAPGANRSGGPELLANPPRHNGGHIIGFVDVHVKWVRASNIQAFGWFPKLEKLKTVKESAEQ